MRLLTFATVSLSCLQDCPDFAERIKRKALRVRSERSIPPYVTEAKSRKQHRDSPLCNSLIVSVLNLSGARQVAPQTLETDAYRERPSFLHRASERLRLVRSIALPMKTIFSRLPLLSKAMTETSINRQQRSQKARFMQSIPLQES